ncbi:MAG: lipoate--protein ligase family protein, partial [bacterium]|nr:lipoate--protein ligase family protein [bacterium]
MTIRLLDFGKVGSLRSLAIFHGVAYALKPEHPDTITLTRPLDPFVSIGHHQDAAAEVDLGYCQQAGVPVYR